MFLILLLTRRGSASAIHARAIRAILGDRQDAMQQPQQPETHPPTQPPGSSGSGPWSDWTTSEPWFGRASQPPPFEPDEQPAPGSADTEQASSARPEAEPSTAAASEATPRPAHTRALLRSLQGALAAVAVLVGVAALAGTNEFSAALLRVRAEHLLGAGDFAGASALLARALDDAPDSARLVLLKIKADLLAGEANTAFALMERL